MLNILPNTQHATDIEGQDIICFANDWDSDPLSKKHIMTRLARNNRILWVNSIGTRNPTASTRDFRRAAGKLREFARGYKRPEKNIVVFSPLAIPFHSSPVAREINKRWLSWSVRRVARELEFRNPITWSFLPSASGVAGTLGEKLIIYHCVDEFSEFTGTDKAALLEMERGLIQKSDAVIVSSGPLHTAKKGHNANTFLVTHGVDVDHFRKACEPQTKVPDEIASLRGPVIGFFGLIADWVDLELIRFLASAKPDWSFVLIGKIETNTDVLKDHSNVRLLGRREYRDLPAYCKGFSVGILPFAINALTIAANPLKLREYLAAGLPVVSTAIPEAQRLHGLVRTADNYEHFLNQIEGLIAEGTYGPQLAISQTMDSESWDERVSELNQIVQSAISARASRKDLMAGLNLRNQELWTGNR